MWILLKNSVLFFGKEAEKEIKLVNLKELCSTEISSNLNRSEPEHVLYKLFVWLQMTHFIRANLSFFGAKCFNLL